MSDACIDQLTAASAGWGHSTGRMSSHIPKPFRSVSIADRSIDSPAATLMRYSTSTSALFDNQHIRPQQYPGPVGKFPGTGLGWNSTYVVPVRAPHTAPAVPGRCTGPATLALVMISFLSTTHILKDCHPTLDDDVLKEGHEALQPRAQFSQHDLSKTDDCRVAGWSVKYKQPRSDSGNRRRSTAYADACPR
jgi:hypothetical protein